MAISKKSKSTEASRSNGKGMMTEVNRIEFPSIEEPDSKSSFATSMFENIPVKVTAELGSASISLKDIYELAEGSIIELDRHAGEPLDLLVNGQLVAQGEVVAVDNNYGLRIKSIIRNKK